MSRFSRKGCLKSQKFQKVIQMAWVRPGLEWLRCHSQVSYYVISLFIKYKRFWKVAWIQSLHLHWKFKLLVGKFDLKTKSLLTSHTTQQCFALLHEVNFPVNNLNFPWRGRLWDRIQAIFFNLFYFIIMCTVQMSPCTR